MKALIGLVLCLLSAASFAQQQPAIDGNWIKNSIDAYDRVNVTRNGTSDDVSDSLLFIYYVSGMLAVHRQNNLLASMFAFGLDKAKKPQPNAAASAEIDKQLRIAFAFTPLLAIPDTLTPQQIVAILRKYLNANPEKWGTNAPLLITNAFQEAFAKK